MSSAVTGTWLSGASELVLLKVRGHLVAAWPAHIIFSPFCAGAAMGAAASAPTGAPAVGADAGAAVAPRAAGAATRSLATGPAAAQGRGLPLTTGGRGAGAAAACPPARGRGGRSGRRAGGLSRGEGTRMRRQRRCLAWALVQR